ncbi:MAG: YlxR family protein [Deltaproteobacteria bacterium]|nr:YlxR family protein [Deltaproteobacteria bacterium]MBZ0218820.1 YlxR family protein [Deltaproteobacteria bacterium]
MPDRTCLGCRSVLQKSSLVRLALDGEGRLRPDLPGRLGGRGAYICPDEACLKAALKKNAFHRALRSVPSVPAADVLWNEIKGAAGETG